MMMTRMLGFDAHTRRQRRIGAAVGGFALVALGAALTGAADLTATLAWLLPAAGGLAAWRLLLPRLRRLTGWFAAGQQPRDDAAHFRRRRVRICWGGQACAIDADDALRAMGVRREPMMLHRLALRYGDARFFQDENGRWWFCETALLDWLHCRAQDGDQRALHFQHWLERKALPPVRGPAAAGDLPPGASGSSGTPDRQQ